MLPVTFRQLAADDLSDLDWSGGTAHLRAVAEAFAAASTAAVEVVVGELPNGRLVALGGLDFRPVSGVGVSWMLAVHETVRGLGIGTALIEVLEDRARTRACRAVRLSVEHDNPAAARLYARLGYREVGTAVESWPIGERRTYVTVCTVLERSL